MGQFFILFITLVLAVLGTVSKTMDESEAHFPKRVTKWGWLVIMLLVISFLLSWGSMIASDRDAIRKEEEIKRLGENLDAAQSALSSQQTISLLSVLERWHANGPYVFFIRFKDKTEDSNPDGFSRFANKVEKITIEQSRAEGLSPNYVFLKRNTEGNDYILEEPDGKSPQNPEAVIPYQLDDRTDYSFPIEPYSDLYEALYELGKGGTTTIKFDYLQIPQTDDIAELERLFRAQKKTTFDLRVPIAKDRKVEKEDNGETSPEAVKETYWRFCVPLVLESVRKEDKSLILLFAMQKPVLEHDYDSAPGP